jgi:hypothetical protein
MYRGKRLESDRRLLDQSIVGESTPQLGHVPTMATVCADNAEHPGVGDQDTGHFWSTNAGTCQTVGVLVLCQGPALTLM